ncbi:MAG: hypothetical protein AAGJ35_03675, partial [Myxococcota bacterium]
VILNQGTLKCWGSNQYGQLGYGDDRDKDRPTQENIPLFGEKVKQVAAGYEHTCVILEQGTLKCWGNNRYGQLGYGETNTTLPKLLKPSRKVIALQSQTVRYVCTGTRHSCVVLGNGHVKCWGDNLYGQLGYPDQKNRTAPSTSSVPIQAGKARTASCQNDHTCVLMEDKSIYCWGRERQGQLGHFHENPLAFPILEALP